MPPKARVLNDEELAQVEALALDDARKIQQSIVYGLCGHDGKLFYIGKTTNPTKRFANYKRADAHGNERLKSILSNNEIYVKVLYSGDDISNKEKELIKKYQSDIVNISGVNYQFFTSRGKPWQAGSGVRCPSDGLMLYTAKNAGFKVLDCYAEVLEVRDRMADSERCVFEISVYKDLPKILKKKYEKWLSVCTLKMLECMEDACKN